MPITTLASYLPTMDEFIVHWSAVNEVLRARGESELVLVEGCALPGFRAARRHLEQLIAAEESAAARWRCLRAEQRQARRIISAQVTPVRELLLAAQGAVGADETDRLASAVALLHGLSIPVPTGQQPEAPRHAPDLASGRLVPSGYVEALHRFHTLSQELRLASRLRRSLGWRLRMECAEIRGWLLQYRRTARFDLDLPLELLRALPARHPGSYRPGTRVG